MDLIVQVERSIQMHHDLVLVIELHDLILEGELVLLNDLFHLDQSL